MRPEQIVESERRERIEKLAARQERVQKHTLSDRPLKGWRAAATVLERCHHKERRELLADLIAKTGIQGPTALRFVARRLRYHADEADYPTPPSPDDLAPADYELCERRAREVLQPLVAANDPRLANRIKDIAA